MSNVHGNCYRLASKPKPSTSNICSGKITLKQEGLETQTFHVASIANLPVMSSAGLPLLYNPFSELMLLARDKVTARDMQGDRSERLRVTTLNHARGILIISTL